MSNPTSNIEAVRDAVVAALQQVSEFAPLSTFDDENNVTASCIVAWKRADPQSITAAKIAAAGLAVVVMIVGAREDGSQSIQAAFNRVPILICINENVTLNQDTALGGTGLGAMYIAERVVANLKEAMLSGLNYPIETDPAVDAIQDGTPFRAMFLQGDDTETQYYTVFVNLFTRADSPARETP